MSDLRATLLERLTDPRSVPILARHAIPVIGVFLFDWSVLETIAALFLDALSTLWLLAAMGSYFAAKAFDYGEPGIIPVLQFWAGVFGAWVVIAGLLTFAIAVPAMFLLPLVAAADVDPMALFTSGWLPRAFALMVACQIPGFVTRVRHFQASGTPPEKMGMDSETGFILHRTVMLAAMATMLAAFGRYALPILVILAQVLGAVSEIMKDRFVGYLMADRNRGSGTAPPVTRRQRRRRRRKR